ncbi:MAG: hypothetical protein ABFE07_09155 [Armatimonadia bacterium]
MTKAEADRLIAKLNAAAAEWQLQKLHIYDGSETYNVRASLRPIINDMTPQETCAYSKNIIDIMSASGDWDLGGERNVAYIVRY